MVPNTPASLCIPNARLLGSASFSFHPIESHQPTYGAAIFTMDRSKKSINRSANINLSPSIKRPQFFIYYNLIIENNGV